MVWPTISADARFGRAGYAAAQSVLLFTVILTVTAVQLRLQKRWVFYG
ncbi:MAG: hypothetical protein ACRDJE_09035 [Dehalococcoidia bacterium]